MRGTSASSGTSLGFQASSVFARGAAVEFARGAAVEFARGAAVEFAWGAAVEFARGALPCSAGRWTPADGI